MVRTVPIAPTVLFSSPSAAERVRQGIGLCCAWRDLSLPLCKRSGFAGAVLLDCVTKKACFTQAKAIPLQGLLPAVMWQLQDDDCDIVKAALTVLSNVLCVVDKHTAGPIALQLLQMLLPLFENVRQ